MALALDLPFHLRGRSGLVQVAIEPSHDPEELGHALVADRYDEEAFRGFPGATATITYEGTGPRAWMGWLQVIQRRDLGGVTTTEVDAVPVFGAACPLYAFGYLPTFADFPANPSHPDGDWLASTFLVAVPDVVRSRTLAAVNGFSWGYRLRAGRPVELFAPRAVAPAAWQQHLTMLRTGYPEWTFLA